ncbi:hypothetical protein ACLPHM_01415 [Paenalcaligenes sp. Me131]|uniref:hypothetical protein n=1 Tax=Paenalcaligenes sp. Me131 TaxID=3392636 RepID=UPI003D2A41DD
MNVYFRRENGRLRRYEVNSFDRLDAIKRVKQCDAESRKACIMVVLNGKARSQNSAPNP